MSRLRAQAQTELMLTLRNGEQLLLMLVIPVLLLVFFSLVDVLPVGDMEPTDFLAPGIIALAVMSTAMVSLGIATGFERSYHVLKRLGATPLGRGRLIAAKIAAVGVVEVLQVALLAGISYALGWSPSATSIGLAVVAVALGTAAFAGIGLTLAGTLRGEINLAAQNGLYLVLLLLGGIVFPLGELPDALSTLAHLLPSAALADVLRESLSGDGVRPTESWIVLAAWAVASPLLARRLFRFQ